MEYPVSCFPLPAQNEAFVAMGFGTRPVTGMIVIDRSDTVHLSQDIRIKKKHFYQAGGEYELKIGEDALLH